VAVVADGGKPPTPPHTFVPSGAGEGKCYSCAHAREHEVHKGGMAIVPPKTPAAAPSEPHAFVPAGDHGTAKHMCKTCGAGKTDPVHMVEASTKPADNPRPRSSAASKEKHA
jgi:hypothetical protein